MSNTYPDGAPQTPYGDPNNAAGAEGAPEPQPTQAFPPVPVIPLPGQGAGAPLAGPQGGAEPYGYPAAPYGQESGAYGEPGAGAAYNQGGAPYGQQPEPGPNPFGQPDANAPYGGEAPTAAYGEPLAGPQGGNGNAPGAPYGQQPEPEYGAGAPTAAYGEPLAGGAPGAYGQPAAPYGGEQPTAAYGQPYGANQYGDPQYGNQPPTIAPQGYGNPYQQEPPKKKSRGPLIAGITAGVVAVIAIIVVVVLFATGVIGGKKDSSADAKPNTSTSQTQGDSKSKSGNSNGDSSSNGNSDGSSSDDLNNLDDALQNGADDTNNDLNNDRSNGSSSSGKPSLEEFVNSSAIQSQLDSMASSYKDMGISIKAYAEGNTLVYDYTLSDTYSSMGDMMTSSLDGMDSTFKSVAQTLNETCDTGGNAKVRVYLHTESGKTLFDKSYTE